MIFFYQCIHLLLQLSISTYTFFHLHISLKIIYISISIYLSLIASIYLFKYRPCLTYLFNKKVSSSIAYTKTPSFRNYRTLEKNPAIFIYEPILMKIYMSSNIQWSFISKVIAGH